MDEELIYDETNTKVIVSGLEWWATETDVAEAIFYGEVKEIKFYCEEGSGRSRGFCTVEFDGPDGAFACQLCTFRVSGKACAVEYFSPVILDLTICTSEVRESQVVESNPSLIDAAGTRKGGVGVPHPVYLPDSGIWAMYTPGVGVSLNDTNREASSSSSTAVVAAAASTLTSTSASAGGADSGGNEGGVVVIDDRSRSGEGASTSTSTYGWRSNQRQQGRRRRRR